MAGDNSYYEDTDWTLMDFTSPAEKAAQSKATIETEKGVCPKCHVHIGRGLFAHMKACNETDKQTS